MWTLLRGHGTRFTWNTQMTWTYTATGENNARTCSREMYRKSRESSWRPLCEFHFWELIMRVLVVWGNLGTVTGWLRVIVNRSMYVEVDRFGSNVGQINWKRVEIGLTADNSRVERENWWEMSPRCYCEGWRSNLATMTEVPFDNWNWWMLSYNSLQAKYHAPSLHYEADDSSSWNAGL